MADTPAKPRLLGQLTVSERLLETLWGILIVLSVTGSAEVGVGATAGQVLAIGLVTGLAWGLVEGVMQIVQGRVERVYSARIIARAAESAESAEPELSTALQSSLVQHLAPEDQARVRAALVEGAARAPAPNLHLQKRDLRGGLETFLTLWASTLPALLPFVLVSEARSALLYSQAIGVVALFAVGWAWGRYSEQRPLRTGAAMAAVGLALAGMLQALGA